MWCRILHKDILSEIYWPLNTVQIINLGEFMVWACRVMWNAKKAFRIMLNLQHVDVAEVKETGLQY